MIHVAGDSTVSSFHDSYYIPRQGYGEELKNYFDSEVMNYAVSGASSKDFVTMKQYAELMENLGKSGGEEFLIIGLGHNDEKTEPGRFTDPNGDYMTAGSFSNSLYENYIKPALERGVVPVVCTPIARLSVENTPESYNGPCGHITPDVVIGDRKYPGGDYPKAIRDMVRDLNNRGFHVEMIDLTEATIRENVRMGEKAKFLHCFTGKTGLDRTHTNIFGAKLNAWLISELARETAPRLAGHSLGCEKPAYEKYFEMSINRDYVEKPYCAPTEQQMSCVFRPSFTDQDGNIWRGSVFGDIGNLSDFTVRRESGSIVLSAENNNGKIAEGSDGILFYYLQLPAGKSFVLSAKARIRRFENNNQISFGLMVRDDLFIDSCVEQLMGDYVAAGVLDQGNTVNFGRKSGELFRPSPVHPVSTAPGSEYELEITANQDGYALVFGDQSASAGFDYALTATDPDFVYAGFYVARNAEVEFSDIRLYYSL